MPNILRKMKTTLTNPVQYHLHLGEDEILLNDYLGKTLALHYTGYIFCIQCGRKTTRSFQQGYCYPCYRRLLECNLCMIHPERCLVEIGKCHTQDWAHHHCHQTHIVYLANTSGVKVGITRETHIPTRWIDQGAQQAVPIIIVKNRYRAGLVEVALKKFVNDKTNWRSMLKNEVTHVNLLECRDQIFHQSHQSLNEIRQKFQDDIEFLNETTVTISYPVLEYPEKITSLSFDKTKEISGILLGIKGQYLILNSGVINLRKYGGYEIQISVKKKVN
ncbi:MAG: hypothetical protein A3F10_07290 [Coxiella sp. RIFCSPHIGHO2_12_FULL_42_15]|nr:MAG: hypothetical protein A3F10_07290 [Coxiella sp. RIFCSPHIGHO2_12_FULL_42_15]